MHLEQNSETMNIHRTKQWNYEPGTKQQQRVPQFQRALIVCKRIPGLTDVTQPNCDFVLWYIRVGSCHCPVLIRTHINTNLFWCLCVKTVCVIFACLFQPLEPIFVCVCVGHREGLLQVRNSHPVDSIWLTVCYFNRWNLHSCGFWWRSDDETQKVNIASSKIVQCWGVKT